jgi:hypothetical protein
LADDGIDWHRCAIFFTQDTDLQARAADAGLGFPTLQAFQVRDGGYIQASADDNLDGAAFLYDLAARWLLRNNIPGRNAIIEGFSNLNP